MAGAERASRGANMRPSQPTRNENATRANNLQGWNALHAGRREMVCCLSAAGRFFQSLLPNLPSVDKAVTHLDAVVKLPVIREVMAKSHVDASHPSVGAL